MHESRMLIVESRILPDVFEKVVAAKRLLRGGDAVTIQDACKQIGLSRSAFYKYKDSVFEYTSQEKGRIITLFMILSHLPGVLSDIINTIASVKGNVITVNQNIPIMDVATLTVTVDSKTMDISPDDLVELLLTCRGCKKIEIIGME